MASKKFGVNIDLDGNEFNNLRVETADIGSLSPVGQDKRIVYYNGKYYYSDNVNWIVFGNGTIFPPIFLGAPTTFTSSPQTLNATMGVVIGNMATTCTINLPSASSCGGRLYVVKNIGVGDVVIVPNGTEKVDNLFTTITLQTRLAIQLYSDGVLWRSLAIRNSYQNSFVQYSSPTPSGIIIAGSGSIVLNSTDPANFYQPFTRIRSGNPASSLEYRQFFTMPSDYEIILSATIRCRVNSVNVALTFGTAQGGVNIDAQQTITPTAINTWEDRTVTLSGATYLGENQYYFRAIGSNMANGNNFDISSIRLRYRIVKMTL